MMTMMMNNIPPTAPPIAAPDELLLLTSDDVAILKISHCSKYLAICNYTYIPYP